MALIASALWGMVRPGDRIPYYRLPPKEKLGGIGPLAKYWRPALAEALPDEEGDLILDMRSAAYSAMWKPKRAKKPPTDPESAGTIAEEAGFTVEVNGDNLDVIV